MRTNRISQKLAVGILVGSVTFMNIIDTTIINVAVPTIGRDFDVSIASVDSIAIGFLVSLAAFVPAAGWIGDRLGNKRALLGSILVFTVASALCGAAQNLGQLVLFRVLQGAGGGLLLPVGMAMLMHVFPPAERLTASTVMAIPATTAPALGPVLGGVFTEHLSWRWCFFINVPVGAAALIWGCLLVDEQRSKNPGRFDLLGFVLAGSGLAFLMYGVSSGPDRGWANPLVLSTIAVGVLALAAMTVVELRNPEPMLDLRLYANRLYRSTLTVMTLMSISFFGVIYVVSLFYQDGLGLSAVNAGLNVLPETIGVAISTRLITKHMYSRVGPRRIMAAGATIVAAMIFGLSSIGLGTSLWQIRAFMLVLGFGIAGIFIPAQTAAFATVPPPQIGRASTLFNSQQRLASAVGIAGITSVVTAIGTTHVVDGHLQAHLISYRVGLICAAAVMLLTALGALFVKDADAAETMRPHATAEPAPEAGGALLPVLSEEPG